MASNTPQSPAPTAPPPAQPAAPAPQKKGTSPLVWILGGCGGVLVLAAIAFGVMTYFVVHKVKGYAASATKNPAVFAAKLAVAANPDLEVVASDDESGTVTIRNKKTGEEITMNAADIKNGRLKFKNEKGEEVTFEGSGQKGKEGLRIKSSKGTMAFGDVEAVKMPAWVPVYAGAKVMASTRQKTEDGFTGTYSFQTPDAAAAVLARYESELDGAGFAVERQSAGALGSLHAKADGGARTVSVSAIPIGATTHVTVEYGATGGAKE
ncbi:MAG TPA: hypothetical protein PK435_03240 [Thermoanaerobaculaceae bacterium]|nr:hypothetical protein [Thermoanaerobaculaceae bacterium]